MTRSRSERFVGLSDYQLLVLFRLEIKMISSVTPQMKASEQANGDRLGGYGRVWVLTLYLDLQVVDRLFVAVEAVNVFLHGSNSLLIIALELIVILQELDLFLV